MSEPVSSDSRARLRPDDGRLARGRRSRDRIQRAARELFRERGFDGATLRAIAERALTQIEAWRAALPCPLGSLAPTSDNAHHEDASPLVS